MQKKVLCCVLVFMFAFSICARADVSEQPYVQSVNGLIATEYYSDDLLEEPSETAATVPMTSAPDVKATSVALMEASTGNILHENNAREKLSPASITKIMTMLLVVEAVDNGKITLSDKVETSEHAASMGGSQIWLKPGETMTVDELLKAAAVGSANDASVALAEYVAGSEEGFVAMMNQRAQELGMEDTTFRNACGLDEDGHMTSARDVAIMARELIRHDTIKKYSTIWMDSLRDGATQLVNTNKLVRYYMGATGLKTGTTDKAGFCLAATAKRDGMELIAVVMHGESSNERFTGGKKLLDYGFANWGIVTPEFDVAQLQDIRVVKGQKQSVQIDVGPIQNQLVKKGGASGVTTELSLDKSVQAPVQEGQKVGSVRVLVDGEEAAVYNVCTVESVEKINWSFCFSRLFAQFLTL